MSQKSINKSLQKTLLSPLTHDLLWSQYLEAFSYELQNMRNEYSLIENNWNINKNDKDNLIRISESFGYTPNLTINNTINMSKSEINSIPYRIREKTTYNGYSLIFQQNNHKGDIFNYYWNDRKLIKVINYEDTVKNLNNSNHYSPFYGILPIKNYSSVVDSTNIILDYLVNGQPKSDDFGIRLYSLDQTIGSSIWQLDKSYLQIPTKHLGIEYFPQTYYCLYETSLGIASDNEFIYETQIELLNYYISKSMQIKINNIVYETTIEIENEKEFFIDENHILNENSYFDLKENLVHIEFNEIPINCEISITYDINLLMTSDYFYYLEQGMEYNRRCPIIPHCGIFLSADIAQSRGSDFYYPNEGNYTIPDLKLKAITSSAYNRYITLNEVSILDNSMTADGQPSGEENYKLDSVVKLFLDSSTFQTKSLIDNFKYIACGNQALNVIDENHNQIFNQKHLVFYYNLNNEDYNPLIQDISSNNINCTVVGNNIKINSVINKSLNFDGETYAYSTSTLSVDASSDYTFGMWFKATSNGNNIKTLFDSFINISYDYINQKLIINSHEYECFINEYHFLCLLFESNTISVYIDGNMIDSFNFTITPSSNIIYIGTDSSTNDDFYGEIDNLWLLSKILTFEEINYVYNNKISIISRMGNRLAYYDLYDDEKYEDDNYTLIQSYVKSMDITNEKTLLDDNETSENFTSRTKFHPIIPSYFNIIYTNSFGNNIEISSNEKGKFYNTESGEIITGSIDFESGIWELAKNTVKSVSQKVIASPKKDTHPISYNIIDPEQPNEQIWYETKTPSGTYENRINADEFDIKNAELENSLYIYTEDYDSSHEEIYSSDNENYYVKYNNEETYISTFIANSDDNETTLYSYDEGKTLYSNLEDLIDGKYTSNQIKLLSFSDLGETTGTTLYTLNDLNTCYINISSTINSDESSRIRKWNLTLSDNTTAIGYTLGNVNFTQLLSNKFYANLSFTSILTPTLVQETTFNPFYIPIKCTQTDMSQSLTLVQSIFAYKNMTSINNIKRLEAVNIDDDNNLEIIKESISFDYWMLTDGVLTKYSVPIDSDGRFTGINIISGYFDYSTNKLTVEFDEKITSEIPISYEYYYSLDVNYNIPITTNYKIKKSIKINEIGLEDENHELMAYMTFPDIEFHTIYDNASVMFAIKKS